MRLTIPRGGRTRRATRRGRRPRPVERGLVMFLVPACALYTSTESSNSAVACPPQGRTLIAARAWLSQAAARRLCFGSGPAPMCHRSENRKGAARMRR